VIAALWQILKESGKISNILRNKITKISGDFEKKSGNVFQHFEKNLQKFLQMFNNFGHLHNPGAELNRLPR
jgi:hypothetical protein